MTEVQLPTLGRTIHFVNKHGLEQVGTVVGTYHDLANGDTLVVRVLSSAEPQDDRNIHLGSKNYNADDKAPATWHWPERERSPETEVTPAENRQRIIEGQVVQDTGWSFGDQS